MKNNVVKYLDFVLLVAQVVMAVVIALSRDVIPTHWNYSGEIDGCGSSYSQYSFVCAF